MGNMVAGHEFINRVTKKQVFGLCFLIYNTAIYLMKNFSSYFSLSLLMKSWSHASSSFPVRGWLFPTSFY